jgi:hypothetical protein
MEMRSAARLVLSLALAGCSSGGVYLPRDLAGGGPDLAGTDLSGADLATEGRDLAGPVDAATAVDLTVAAPLSGCWITTTNSGNTRLDLVQQGMVVTGTLSWTTDVYPIQGGLYQNGALTFTVDWTNEMFSASYDFSTATATMMSGTAVSGTNTQAITAARTCP